jgi:hypothetical protein
VRSCVAAVCKPVIHGSQALLTRSRVVKDQSNWYSDQRRLGCRPTYQHNLIGSASALANAGCVAEFEMAVSSRWLCHQGVMSSYTLMAQRQSVACGSMHECRCNAEEACRYSMQQLTVRSPQRDGRRTQNQRSACWRTGRSRSPKGRLQCAMACFMQQCLGHSDALQLVPAMVQLAVLDHNAGGSQLCCDCPVATARPQLAPQHLADRRV